jgi:hypothetical protein
MNAYAGCVSATTTRDSPWYIVPADDKANTWLIISQIILNTLEELKLDLSQTQQSTPQGVTGDPEITGEVGLIRSHFGGRWYLLVPSSSRIDKSTTRLALIAPSFLSMYPDIRSRFLTASSGG